MDEEKKSNYRPELYTEAARRDRFIRVAEKRINKILNDFRLLGNTSNKSLYLYDDGDIDKIFTVIEQRLVETRAKFKTKNKEKPFRLE